MKTTKQELHNTPLEQIIQQNTRLLEKQTLLDPDYQERKWQYYAWINLENGHIPPTSRMHRP